MRDLVAKLHSEINKLPLYDIHTHMDAGHISARGLHDVLLYHMVISDLYSAGCPGGSRLSEDADEEEIEFRITEAIPYLPEIALTNCYWGVRIILKDIYGWDEPVTLENWREIDGIIRERYKERNFGRRIIKKANVLRACTELSRRRDGSADDIFQYSLEWAFFARSQYGKFDTALVELEYAWNMEKAGLPMPVTCDVTALNLKKRIKTVDDIHSAMEHYIKNVPGDEIIYAAAHFSTYIHYEKVTRRDVEKALENRGNAGEKERDIYSNYINRLYIEQMTENYPDVMLSFSMGAEPLPFETGSILRMETISELADLFHEFPNTKFMLHNASLHQNQALCTLARELPNVYLGGYWWHSFFATAIRQIMNERMEMLAANKNMLFFSDAYCADWLYAKSVIVKRQLAEILSVKIEQGQFTVEEALTMIAHMFKDVPERELNMEEGYATEQLLSRAQ